MKCCSCGSSEWGFVSTQLSSILGVFNRPKRIQTPHILFWDFWAEKTLQLVGQTVPAGHLAITLEGYSRRQSKVFTAAKSMAQLLRQHSSTACAGQTGSTNTGCFLVCCSHCLQLQALLRNKSYHTCYIDLVLESKRLKTVCNFWAVTTFCMWNKNFNRIGKILLSTKAALIASLNLQSFICFWVKIGHRKKTACSKSNPVQSSRSKKTTFLRKGHMLSLKFISGMILILSQSKFVAKSVSNEMQGFKS